MKIHAGTPMTHWSSALFDEICHMIPHVGLYNAQTKGSLKILKRLGGQVISAPDFGSRGPGFESHWRRNSAQDYMTLHYTEMFTITPPSARYYLNNIEKDVKPKQSSSLQDSMHVPKSASQLLVASHKPGKDQTWFVRNTEWPSNPSTIKYPE